MNLSSLSIRHPVPAAMLFVLLTFAGLLGFYAMKVQNFPDIDLPTVSVVATLPGASPAQLETDVARKLENSIATLQGLKHIYTKIVDGVVTITVEFHLEKPVQEAVDDVRSAIARVRGDLPSDMQAPFVAKLGVATQPVLAYAITSSRMDDEALSWFVDNDVSRKLSAVRGVGGVNRVGGVTREVHVALDATKVQSLGATVAEISSQLRQVQMDTAGGRLNLGGEDQPIRILATVKMAKEIGGVRVALRNGRSIKLEDVAEVTDTTAEQRTAVYLNGKLMVGFEVSRGKGESEVAVGYAVQAALEELRARRPDIELTKVLDFVTPVEEEYEGSLHLLYEGAFLTMVVVWLFLRDWRATFVSAIALPMSVIPAFAGMYLLGFSVNVLTLLALSLVIGVLVDDAIVEVENIVRHLRMGKTPYQAAMEATDEIGLAVIATTFTLIAVFLPTAFMSGVAGKFFKQFGLTASLAVAASLLVARVLTPMLAAYMLKPTVVVQEDPKWMKGYLNCVVWCLKHRMITVSASGIFLIGSILLVPLLPTGFIPPDDNSQTQISIELQPGSTLRQTSDSAEQARQILMTVKHVNSVYSIIGASGDTRLAVLFVELSERGDRPRKQIIENNIRTALESLPGVRIKVGSGGSGEKYILVLSGEDPVALQSSAMAVEKDLRTISGLGSVASTASLIRPEIAMRPDFARAADLGVTSAAIGETLRIATAGDYDVALPKLNLSERQVRIVVKLQDDARKDLTVLERLTVPGTRGPVMLSQVAALKMTGGPEAIHRYDRQRNVNFEIELSGLPLGDVVAAAQQLPAIKNLPTSVKVIEMGDAEVMGELFTGFGLAMLTGVLCIYIVLVLLFKDFLHPITILVALPLALGGAFLGLLVAEKSFSMPSLIGLVMLMGIATKNSILLVEYAIVARRDEGLSRFDALLDACHKRVRPIIMTTAAMGAGMMPLAIGLGTADPSFRSPMAVAVIGGLITSTVLSLLVVPVVFTVLDDINVSWNRMINFVLRKI